MLSDRTIIFIKPVQILQLHPECQFYGWLFPIYKKRQGMDDSFTQSQAQQATQHRIKAKFSLTYPETTATRQQHNKCLSVCLSVFAKEMENIYCKSKGISV